MFRLSSIAGALGRRPVLVLVLLSWLGFPVLALASGAPAWSVKLLRVLVAPAYVGWLGLFLLTAAVPEGRIG